MKNPLPGDSQARNANRAPRLRKALWLMLVAGLLVSCSTPEPTELELTYARKMKESGGKFVSLWQTPQAELSPDSEIAILRDSYTAEAISDIAQYVLDTYKNDLEGAISYLKTQRFECIGIRFVKCETYTKVSPLTVDPLAFLRSKPTHCITWRIDLSGQENTIEKLTRSSFVTDCRK